MNSMNFSIPDFGMGLPAVQNPAPIAAAHSTILPIVSHSWAEPTRFKVINMQIIDAGVYNEQMVRSFETHVNNRVIENFQRLVDNCSKINSIPNMAISGTAWQFMSLSATPYGVANIHNGWAAKRLRFVLIVEELNSLSVRTRIRHIFQGYTEMHDVSLTGFINPNMNFYINSFMTVSRDEIDTATGKSVSDRIVGSGQMMDPATMYAGISVTDNKPSDRIQLMRPSDLMASAQMAHVKNYTASTTGAKSPVLDGRVAMTSASSFNSRSNNQIVSYVKGAVDAMRYATAYETFGDTSEGMYDKAFSKLYAGSVTDNPFLLALGSQLGITGTCCRFDLNTLVTIDRTFVKPKYDKYVGNAATTLVSGLDSASWKPTDLVTKAAATIANEVPALASDLLLHALRFVVTNTTVDGSADWRWAYVNSTSGNNMDLQRVASIFQERFKSETINNLTHSGYLSYWMEVIYNVFDDIQIKLTIDGSDITNYAKPTYCDSLTPPIVAPNMEHVHKVVSDMENLFGHVQFHAGNNDSDVTSGLNFTMPKITV